MKNRCQGIAILELAIAIVIILPLLVFSSLLSEYQVAQGQIFSFLQKELQAIRIPYKIESDNYYIQLSADANLLAQKMNLISSDLLKVHRLMPISRFLDLTANLVIFECHKNSTKIIYGHTARASQLCSLIQDRNIADKFEPQLMIVIAMADLNWQSGGENLVSYLPENFFKTKTLEFVLRTHNSWPEL